MPRVPGAIFLEDIVVRDATFETLGKQTDGRGRA
jgi:hypothetical protein